MTRHKLIKTVQVHWFTTIVHKSGYPVLISMVVAMTMWVITFVMMLMATTMWVVALMMMLVIVMMMVVAMVLMLVMVMVLLFNVAFHPLDPRSRSSYLFEVEEFGIQYLAKWHIAVIAVNDFSFGLDSTKNSTNMFAFLIAHLRYLI